MPTVERHYDVDRHYDPAAGGQARGAHPLDAHPPRSRTGAPGTTNDPAAPPRVSFHFGDAGALLPLLTFVGGVAWLGLSGAPDERGFWPVLLLALGVGTLLARDRKGYSDAVLAGMGRPLVMTMIVAWILAGVLGAIISGSGFVEATVALASSLGVRGPALVLSAFVIGALVSTATGTSLGTLLVCVPLLHPAGVALGADPAVLVGALLGGATFGDNVSPVSDTTIASAGTQGAELGAVVRSRMRYALPAAGLAALLYVAASIGQSNGAPEPASTQANASTLWVGLGPLFAIALLLRRRTLLEGLLGGIVATLALALALDAIQWGDLVRIDPDAFIARGLILSGMERSVGLVVFTLLLMGIVGGIEASGLLDRVVRQIQARATTPAGAEWSIFAAVSAAVVLTTHSGVAILTTGRLARETGTAAGIGAERRSNILDVTVCTYPFLFPLFIPTILAANLTASEAGAAAGRVDPWSAGLHNFHSWALLAVLLFAIATGWGRGGASAEVAGAGHDRAGSRGTTSVDDQ